MRKTVASIFMLMVLLALAACGVVSYHHSSTGAAISDEQLKKIKPGMSSDDVILLLGTPTEVQKLEDGRKVYVYRWQRGSGATFLWGTLGTKSTKSYYVTIIFDQQNKVQKVGKGKGGPTQITPAITIQHQEKAQPTAPPTL